MTFSPTTLRLLSVCLLLAGIGLSEPGRSELSWQAICETTVCRATGHDGVFDARISPDGRLVAVTVHTPRTQGIYLYSRDSDQTAFLADGSSPSWFGDSKRLVYVRDNDLWSIGPGDEAPFRITNDENDVRVPRASPDARTIAFYSSRSGYQDIWLVASDGQSAPHQLTRSSMSIDEPRFVHAWSPDSRQIAYFSNQGEFWEDDLWLVDVGSGETRQISRSFMGQSEPSWSPDGSRLAVYGTAKSGFWYGDMADIYLIEPDADREWSIAMQVHASEIGKVGWSKDGHELFFPVHERGRLDLWRVSASGGVATRITNTGGVIHDFDTTIGGDEFAIVRSTPTRGRELELVSVQGGPSRQVTRFATQWPGLIEPVEISYRSHDGLYIQGFMFQPPDFDPQRRYPALVQVHGGGTNSYLNGLNLVEQRLARQGYVVLAINYRGGSGFGRKFQDLAVNDWANSQALDAAAAATFLRDHSWSNGKVGIYGYSYGGIISLAAATRAPEAFDAAVPMGGIYDWADAWQNADRLGKLFTAQGHGGTPEQRPEVYAISNSVARIPDLQTPVLIMHGQADTRAPYRQFELVVDALKAHDKVFDSHSYPDEPHRFQNPDNRVDMYQRLEAWMDRWLR
jgi:dipeptidyl aminopeptidase/acylaminoacyl peptidase